MTRTVAAILLALILTLVGCAPGSTLPPPPPVIPDELVGGWNVITPRGSAFSYEISAKDTYIHVGIMSDGTQQYTLQESGTVRVRDTQITFRPESVTITRSDSSTPAENDRRSTARPPRTLTWSVSGDQLTLTEEGEPTTYERE